jgi:uncharacterized protein YycO
MTAGTITKVKAIRITSGITARRPMASVLNAPVANMARRMEQPPAARMTEEYKLGG